MDIYYDGVKSAGLNNILKGIVPTVTNAVDAPIEYAYLYDFSTTTFTNYTTAANNATANDVNLQGPSDNTFDIFFFGSAEQFPYIKVNVGTAGIGGIVGQFFYWDGTQWSALTNVVDNTTIFTVAGTNTITFTLPTDWAVTTVNGQSAYWIEYIHVAGDYTTIPLATQIWLGGQALANLANATDNNTATVTDTLTGNTTGIASIGEFVFNLGTAKTGIFGFLVGAWSSAGSMNIRVDVSTDNVTWYVSSHTAVSESGSTTELILPSFTIMILNRQYVRIRCMNSVTATGYVRLYEVKLYQLE